MEKQNKAYTSPYSLDGRIPLRQAIPLGLQHVLAMFVGNLSPLRGRMDPGIHPYARCASRLCFRAKSKRDPPA